MITINITGQIVLLFGCYLSLSPMNKLLLLFIILCCLCCYNLSAQNLELFDSSKKFNWEQVDSAPLDTPTLKSIFPVVVNKPFHDLKTLINAIDLFHFIDLNKDGVNEIIYNGWTGGEGEMIHVLWENNQKFELKQTILGRIVELNPSSSKAKMTVLDYACCAGYIDHLTYFELNGLVFQITEDYAIPLYKLKDLNLIDPVQFEVQRDPYNFRLYIEIQQNLDPSDYPFDLIQNQNIAAIFSTGDTGTALAEKTDETGRIWWLVVMNNAPKHPRTIFYRGNNGYEQYMPIGWMSSRYLKAKR